MNTYALRSKSQGTITFCFYCVTEYFPLYPHYLLKSIIITDIIIMRAIG